MSTVRVIDPVKVAELQQADALDRVAELAMTLSDADARLADAATDALAAGCSITAVGRHLGVTRQSAAERFLPGRDRELRRAEMRAALWSDDERRVRVTAFGRYVAAYLTSPYFDGGQGWRVIRSCLNDEGAIALARYLAAESRVFHYVGRPRDMPEGGPEPWALPV